MRSRRRVWWLLLASTAAVVALDLLAWGGGGDVEPVGSPTSLVCIASLGQCFRRFRHACLRGRGPSLPGLTVAIGDGHNRNAHFFHGVQRVVPAAAFAALYPGVSRVIYTGGEINPAAWRLAGWLGQQPTEELGAVCPADMVWFGSHERFELAADGRHASLGLPVEVWDEENRVGAAVRGAAYEACGVQAHRGHEPQVATLLLRGNSRDIERPEEVAAALQGPAETMRLSDAPDLCAVVRQMARSRAVVSPHGAQCLNGMFLRPGAVFTVVDIFPLYDYNPFRAFIELAGAEVRSFRAEPPDEWFWAGWRLWWWLSGADSLQDKVERCAPSYPCRWLGKQSGVRVSAGALGESVG